MGSNYKQIGDYIQLVDERNKGLKITNLVGLSISKQFIKSVANTIGTDMENYKIIRKNQFACSTMQVRRDKKMPLALYNEDEPAIISQAYPVFEIIDTSTLSPEYLMMWFTRTEFDREACFHAVGGVRGSLEWEDFCGMKLPVPSLEKQQEIVNEYKTIQNRIKLNENLIQKLEETAQAIYRSWFVESIDLENLPDGWKTGILTDIATIIMGQSPEGETCNKTGSGVIFYQGRTDFGYRFPDITTFTSQPKKKAQKNDILISVRAPVGDLNIAIEDCAIGRGIAALRSKLNCNSHLFYTLKNLKSKFDVSDGEGTIFGSINKDELHNTEVIYSEVEIMKFDKIARPIDERIKNYSVQDKKLKELKELLLAKMTKIEDIKNIN